MDSASASSASGAKRSLATGMNVDGSSIAKTADEDYVIESRWFVSAQVLTPSPHDTPNITTMQSDIIQLVQHLVPFVKSISKAVSEVVDYQSNTHTHTCKY